MTKNKPSKQIYAQNQHKNTKKESEICSKLTVKITE